MFKEYHVFRSPSGTVTKTPTNKSPQEKLEELKSGRYYEEGTKYVGTFADNYLVVSHYPSGVVLIINKDCYTSTKPFKSLIKHCGTWSHFGSNDFNGMELSKEQLKLIYENMEDGDTLKISVPTLLNLK